MSNVKSRRAAFLAALLSTSDQTKLDLARLAYKVAVIVTKPAPLALPASH